MNAVDLRKLQTDELDARIRELRNELFNLRVKHATGQVENSANLRSSHRDLARALTVRKERSE